MVPKISVCIDVYNYAEFLPEAVESVLAQTFEDFELVIVDDCSTDGSLEIAREYAGRDPRIVIARNPRNRGMVGNRNACLALARGEYVKFLHADDFLWSTSALSSMAEPLERNPAVALVASSVQSADARSRPLRDWGWFSGDQVTSGASVIMRSLLEQKNVVGPPSATLFRRSLAGRGFDESYFHAADWEMWCHLLEQGCFAFVDERLVAYRWHPRQQTEKDKLTLTQVHDHHALLSRYLDRPYVRFHWWVKRFLRHEALRRKLRRCLELRLFADAREAVASHGWLRYALDQARFFVWRRRGIPLDHWKRQYLPPRRRLAPVPSAGPAGINVAGFLKGEFGMGEVARAFYRAIQASGVPCSATNIHSDPHRNEDESVSVSEEAPYCINVMAFSFDYARRHYLDAGPVFFDGRHNVAVWFWELETFPNAFHANFDYYDEIWAPTAFCHRAFRRVSPIPVHHVPYPFVPFDGAVPDRSRFYLPENAFVFLFTFDFYSTVQRKNPFGVLEAFRRAFGSSDRAVLVLKSINAQAAPDAYGALVRAADGLNVRCIDAHLPRSEIAAAFATADCYVSLHRSEGLGLGMAQAMSLGKPVIATGYSGNLEYMTEDNSLLVDHEMVELAGSYGPYLSGQRWAEPDIEHAAELMRWVEAHQDEAARIGARGRRDVLRVLDPGRCIAAVRERFHAITRQPTDADG